MPLSRPVMPSESIRARVSAHYGVPNLPVMVVRREDEIACYQALHDEVPSDLWPVVDHTRRLVRMWAAHDVCVDLVVWSPADQDYRLVQDICFIDAYPDAKTWHEAVYDLVKTSAEVWVVTHLED